MAKATAERARLAAAQADLAELKAAKQRGLLLDAEAVESEWSGILRTVRAGMLAVPSRCAAGHCTSYSRPRVSTALISPSISAFWRFLIARSS